jgi:hypothetical protein
VGLSRNIPLQTSKRFSSCKKGVVFAFSLPIVRNCSSSLIIIRSEGLDGAWDSRVLVFDLELLMRIAVVQFSGPSSVTPIIRQPGT